MRIEVSSVSKSYGEVRAVSDLSFTVGEGEVFGLLGPNGSGKTTTVKMIMGLHDPDSGAVSVEGIDPSIDARGAKAQIGYVSEEPVLYSSMTPNDAFELIAAVRGLSEPDTNSRVRQYAASLDALDILDRPIGTLSRGNKQKAEIIAAVLHRPPILILDEPLSGLDARTVRVFREILAMHVEAGGAVVFSTHILQVAEQMCTRICIINGGSEVATGTPAELRSLSTGSGDRAARDLEEVFLTLTDLDDSVDEAVRGLRGDGV